MKHQLIVTDDGSLTLFVPGLNEHYHSTRGAVMESEHVFMKAGLLYFIQQHQTPSVQLLEIGFGTGLNALLTWETCDRLQINCRYETLEKYPLEAEEALMLNYGSPEKLQQLHACEWNNEVQLSPCFSLCKINADLVNYHPQRSFDLIFFDAFAPTVQPGLWTAEIFKKLYAYQPEGGVLVTYSSKGSVKEALRNAGYTVQRLPGAGGKRHMVRATK